MKKQSEAIIPIGKRSFNMISYASSKEEKMPHLALVAGPLDVSKPIMLRIHSECITGDLFGSKRCDCGEQLEKSMRRIGEGSGLLIYLRQEGRGIGLINKLKAYNLQDTGLNTADANTHLGFEVDERAYDIAITILKDLGISVVDLLTNSPDKISAFENSDIKLNKRIPLVIEAKPENQGYLDTKKDLMGHLF